MAGSSRLPDMQGQAADIRMESEPIITFENVGVAFGEEQIYDRLSFDVRHGEFVCILGPSGCGFDRGAIGNETHVALQCSVFKRSEYRFA